jgi:hypothetical protein
MYTWTLSGEMAGRALPIITCEVAHAARQHKAIAKYRVRQYILPNLDCPFPPVKPHPHPKRPESAAAIQLLSREAARRSPIDGLAYLSVRPCRKDRLHHSPTSL